MNDVEVREALSHSEIMGGTQYVEENQGRIVTEDDADVTVETGTQFWNEVTSEDFKIVWVPGDRKIDLATQSAVARNKVIASDRGQDGAPGGMLYTDNRGLNSGAYNGGGGVGVLQSARNVRLTGLRYRGPTYAYWEVTDGRWPGYMPLTDREKRNEWHACGLRIRDSDPADTTVEIDNCEIYGWPTMAVYVSPGSPWIHHNDFHDNMMTSFGYHVNIVRGNPDIEYNYMNNHRHAVCVFGYHDGGFLSRFNVYGPYQSSHALDVHGLHNNLSAARTDTNPDSPMYVGQAGGSVIVDRDTFLADSVIDGPGVNFDRGKPSWAVSIRGWPWPRQGDSVLLINNWFAHDREPSQENGSGNGIRDFSHGGAFNQQIRGGNGEQRFELPVGSDGFTLNYNFSDNNYGAPEGYDPQMGAPINLANPTHTPPEVVDCLRQVIASAVPLSDNASE